MTAPPAGVRHVRLRLVVDDPACHEVPAVLHRPTVARGLGALLLHGAGSDHDDPALVAAADVLAGAGVHAVRADLPFRAAGRRAAPRADRAVPSLRRVHEAARAVVSEVPGPWLLGGRSYGGRVSSLAVADGVPAAGLLLLGYPLHPADRPSLERTDHWPSVGVPCLLVQGDRDRLCDLGLLDTAVRRLPRRARVHVVVGGDHTLAVTARASEDGVARGSAETVSRLAGVMTTWLQAEVAAG